ncbi:MAG: cytochrome c biogenesis protein DipZ [Anaerolineaceae bacterium]|nr:cytochrome c biogenesis protein DipZ [Anaerolineaceae bacterium]
MVILILFSILSGLVTVLSPCILPVLPIVLSSSIEKGKARPLGLITGLIVSFSLFTLAFAQIVSLSGLSANVLRFIAVAVIAVLGLSMLLPALNGLFQKLFGLIPGLLPQSLPQGEGFGGGLITGACLGLLWAPCAGPILAAVTTLAATQAVNFGAVLVVLAYAVGAGVPLLAIAYGGRALFNKAARLTRNPHRIQQSFGLVMLLTAGLMAFNADTLVTAWVTSLEPAAWTNHLDAFESSPLVGQQLAKIDQPLKSIQIPEATPTHVIPAIPETINLPNLGPAPDFTGIYHWLNSSPLTLQDLRGKVVLVDFWTFDCINCIHTLPYVTAWYNKYKDKGFVVIGVHTPEFAVERDTANVAQAIAQYQIKYPVAQDNDYVTWKAYNNQYWPAEYFIDAKGNLRHTFYGEGDYAKSEMIIQQLLAEAGNTANSAQK